MVDLQIRTDKTMVTFVRCTGCVPSEMARMEKLKQLEVQYNSLTGKSVPPWNRECLLVFSPCHLAAMVALTPLTLSPLSKMSLWSMLLPARLLLVPLVFWLNVLQLFYWSKCWSFGDRGHKTTNLLPALLWMLLLLLCVAGTTHISTSFTNCHDVRRSHPLPCIPPSVVSSLPHAPSSETHAAQKGTYCIQLTTRT